VTCTYICKECDAKAALALPDSKSPKHKLSHPLVQIRDSKPIPQPWMTDSRLLNLETKILGLDLKITAVESRLGSLEALLQQVVEKMVN
jgi:hypothetical protein